MFTIYKTTNYGQFKYYINNRFVSEKNLNPALLTSISEKNLLSTHPILVNDKFYVIDGQNRLEVAKKLHIDIYYIIDPKLTDEDIIRLQTQKSWSLKDYLRYHQTHKEDYIFINTICEEYKFMSHIPFVIRSCSTLSDATKSFRLGKYKINKDKKKLIKNFQCIAEIREKIISYFPEFYLSAEGLHAIHIIINNKDYNHKFMIEKVKQYKDNVLTSFKFKNRSNIIDSLVNRVYNYYNKKDETKIEIF